MHLVFCNLLIIKYNNAIAFYGSLWICFGLCFYVIVQLKTTCSISTFKNELTLCLENVTPNRGQDDS